MFYWYFFPGNTQTTVLGDSSLFTFPIHRLTKTLLSHRQGMNSDFWTSSHLMLISKIWKVSNISEMNITLKLSKSRGTLASSYHGSSSGVTFDPTLYVLLWRSHFPFPWNREEQRAGQGEGAVRSWVGEGEEPNIYQLPGPTGGSAGKESASNVGDLGSIPGSGRSPGGGHGNPLQYSCLENPTDRGARRATAHGVAVGHDWVTKHTIPQSILAAAWRWPLHGGSWCEAWPGGRAAGGLVGSSPS